jgi:hypothetical protein
MAPSCQSAPLLSHYKFKKPSVRHSLDSSNSIALLPLSSGMLCPDSEASPTFSSCCVRVQSRLLTASSDPAPSASRLHSAITNLAVACWRRRASDSDLSCLHSFPANRTSALILVIAFSEPSINSHLLLPTFLPPSFLPSFPTHPSTSHRAKSPLSFPPIPEERYPRRL